MLEQSKYIPITILLTKFLISKGNSSRIILFKPDTVVEELIKQ